MQGAMSSAESSLPESARSFATTRWSMVLSARGDTTGAQTALAKLCEVYWYPLYAFVRRQGHSAHDAQDLTQDFCLMVLKGDLIQHADRSRGRFRSLLLTALQNFLIDAYAKRSAQKRGGDMQFVSWDDWMAEAPSRLSIPAPRQAAL
jgi:RNA polymerase sigma-70 factor (ECF subfamily)